MKEAVDSPSLAERHWQSLGVWTMRKTITLAAMALLTIGLLGCKHEQVAVGPKPAPQPVIAPDTTGKVIVHIVSRNQTITVKSGPNGVVYSLRDAAGKLML